MAMSYNFSFDTSSTDFYSLFGISIVHSGEPYSRTTTTLNDQNTLWLILDPSENDNVNPNVGCIIPI